MDEAAIIAIDYEVVQEEMVDGGDLVCCVVRALGLFWGECMFFGCVIVDNGCY